MTYSAALSFHFSRSPEFHPTFGDLKNFIRSMEKINLPDDHALEDCDISIYTEHVNPNVDLIYCGECAPMFENYDLVIAAHQCPGIPPKAQD